MVRDCFSHERRKPHANQLDHGVQRGRPWPHFSMDAERRAYTFANASVMSSMRLEKPHSLSYHDSTLTRVPPITRVCVAS